MDYFNHYGDSTAQAGTYVLTIIALSENITKVREFSLIILEKPSTSSYGY
ncbi:MAG: hypothetical protein N3E36_03475 [Sulfolobales archaeon]|nr:hypothetical protein [Sulfolobales archaeon]MCX8199073.1 hypothetical protein [Sulfolobales archaeon]MDW8170052.1 hypothetical protein [Desulfurococcaceae archaeon]